jgi:hypothetical protein
LTRIRPGWQLATLAVCVSLWLGLTGLLVVSRGNPEAFLLTSLGRFSRADAFEHLNGISTLVWSLHSLLMLMAIVAIWQRRTDVLTVLMIGPVIAVAIALLGQRWADPNWFDVVAVCAIGWLVGIVVGCGLWILKSRPARPDASLRQVSNAAKKTSFIGRNG